MTDAPPRRAPARVRGRSTAPYGTRVVVVVLRSPVLVVTAASAWRWAACSPDRRRRARRRGPARERRRSSGMAQIARSLFPLQISERTEVRAHRELRPRPPALAGPRGGRGDPRAAPRPADAADGRKRRAARGPGRAAGLPLARARQDAGDAGDRVLGDAAGGACSACRWPVQRAQLHAEPPAYGWRAAW